MTVISEAEQNELDRRAEATRELLESANRRYFERECLHEGVDLSRGVSPALLKTMERQHEV